MRKPGWESLLAEYLQAGQDTPFEWGQHDCALFAARWVLLSTGFDHFSEWKGEYASEKGAARLMRERGFRSVADIADAHLIETPVPLAGRGDLVLDPNGCLGICNGLRSHFAGIDGMIVTPTRLCVRAWKVG